jgi:hypothetical protein
MRGCWQAASFPPADIKAARDVFRYRTKPGIFEAVGCGAAGLCEFRLSQERYSKPHVIEKKKSARAASNASW